MQEQKSASLDQKKKKPELLAAILCVFLLTVIVSGVAFYLHCAGNNDQEENPIGYESAVVVTDQEGAQKLGKKPDKGAMALEYKHVAASADGRRFSCYLANAAENGCDMYMGIYLDQKLSDEVLLTKLIPPGSRLESFETSRQLEPGNYDAVLVFTTVKDDHKTIKNQVCVAYTLTVQ